MKNTIEKRFEKTQAKLSNNRKAIEYKNLKKRIGSSLKMKAYHNLIQLQNKLCAICLEQLAEAKGCHVDHDHKTGKIRGLLCINCNVGLGHFKDNQKLLEAAWSYLEKHKPIQTDEEWQKIIETT